MPTAAEFPLAVLMLIQNLKEKLSESLSAKARGPELGQGEPGGYTDPSVADLYGGGGIPLRVMTRPEFEQIVKLANKTGMGANWFRGHSGDRPVRDVLREGFLDRAQLEHWGEPLGISVTSSPVKGQEFAHGEPERLLRVALLHKPSEVLDLGGTLDLMSPDLAADILRMSEREALNKYQSPALQSTPIEFMKRMMRERGMSEDEALHKAFRSMPKETEMLNFNRELANAIQRRGYEAVAYHPNRYSEWEIRALNREKAVPVGFVGASPAKIPSVDKIINSASYGVTEHFLKRVKLPEPGDLAYKDWLEKISTLAKEKGYDTAEVRQIRRDIARSAKSTDQEVLDRYKRRYSDVFESPRDYDEVQDVHLHEIYEKEPGSWYMGTELPKYNPDTVEIANKIHKHESTSGLLETSVIDDIVYAALVPENQGKGLQVIADDMGLMPTHEDYTKIIAKLDYLKEKGYQYGVSKFSEFDKLVAEAEGKLSMDEALKALGMPLNPSSMKPLIETPGIPEVFTSDDDLFGYLASAYNNNKGLYGVDYIAKQILGIDLEPDAINKIKDLATKYKSP